MKILKEFKGRADQKDCQFKMIDRSGDVAIYSRTDKVGKETYEVVVIKTSKRDWVIDGKVAVPAGKESYPPSSAWGTSGWTFGTIEKAREKFAEVCED